MSNVLDAAYMTAHEYPGGAKALALRLGVATLSNRLNPNNHEHHLTVRDLMAIMMLTGDHRALHAMCVELGYMALPLPAVGEETTTDAITDTVREFSEFLTAVTNTLADKRVTKTELRKVRKELSELCAMGAKLESILAAMEARGARP